YSAKADIRDELIAMQVHWTFHLRTSGGEPQLDLT
ncbi:unnamed protein product, partial [Rotaria magnacalcarata]